MQALSTIKFRHSRGQFVYNLHEKWETELAFKKFINFIKNYTWRSVKKLTHDEKREFVVCNFKKNFFLAKKRKLKLSVAYSPELNSIPENTKGLMVTMARYSLFKSHLEMKMGFFWPDIFLISVYLSIFLYQTSSTLNINFNFDWENII